MSEAKLGDVIVVSTTDGDAPAIVTKVHEDGSYNVRVFAGDPTASDQYRSHVDAEGNAFDYGAVSTTPTAGQQAVYGAGGSPVAPTAVPTPAPAPAAPVVPPATFGANGAEVDPPAEQPANAPAAAQVPTALGTAPTTGQAAEQPGATVTEPHADATPPASPQGAGY